MATVTKLEAEYADGLVRFEYDYDDATLRLTALRCVNNTSQAAYGKATQTSNGRTHERTFGADQTTAVAIPTGAAQRLQLVLGSNGKLDGVSIETRWPA